MSKKDILIVEDENIIAMDIQMVLNEMGYNVCGIIDKGEDVYPIVEKEPPDLILMDITLKGKMNGFDAAKSLYEKNYDIPIIYCSAEINKNRLDKAKLPNTYGYLIKPLKEDNLYTTIELTIDKANLERKLKIKNQELEKANEELEETNEELEKANEELEETNEELIRNEKIFYNLFEKANDAIFIADAENGILLNANKAAEELIGYKKNSIIGKHQSTLHPPYQHNLVVESFKEDGNQKGEAVYKEFELLHKDGHTIPVEICPSIIYINEKKAVYGVFRDITQRKRMEQKLRENEEKLRMVIKNMPVMLDAFDVNNRIIMWNKECERVTGYSEEEMLSSDDPMTLLYPDEDYRKEVMDSWTYRDDNLISNDTVVTKKNGEKRLINWINISKSNPIKGWNEWAIGIDVTERKKYEQQLKESEDRYKKLFFGFINPVSIYDEDANIILINNPEKSLFKGNRDELIGKSLKDIIPDKYEIIKERVKKVLESGEPLIVEDHIKTDITSRYFMSYFSPIYNYEKGLDVVQVISYDITERILLEEKLRENEAYLKTILENTKDGIVSSLPEKDFLITFWNKGAEEIYGYTSSEAVGQKSDEFLKTRFTIISKKEAQKFLYDNNYWEGEILQKNKAGEDINILISIKLFKNPRDNSIEAVSIHRNITEQKQSEKKLKEYTEKLRKSNHELESFAHRAAHDLKNPLNILISGLKILKKNRNMDEEKRTYLINTMIERSNLLINQVNNILKYAQINEEKNLIKVNVKNMVNKTISDLDKIIKEKDAEIITKDLDKEIKVDMGLFYSLIYNLINNALKYNENKPQIIISLEDKEDEWLFSIKDNGIGINEKDNHKVFELMFRVKDVKGTYEGTGIGLASCKKIVEIHNGSIWLESELGKGSTFYFTIPKTNPNT